MTSLQEHKQITTRKRSFCELTSNATAYYAEYWTDGIAVNPKTEKLCRWIVDTYLPDIKNRRIIEVGIGGEGGVSRLLAGENEVSGVDISPSAVNNCSRLGLNVQLCDLSYEKIALSDESADVVIALEVFEHFSNPQAALEEIRRLLKATGMLLVSVPTPWSFHWPRLFYPSLFEAKEAFGDFLAANRFKLLKLDDGIVRCNERRNIPDRFKIWNWYFLCQKISDTDADGYLQLGMYFWNRCNEYGVRQSPVEAVDFFRKYWQLSGDDASLLLFARSLLYRLLSGEITEFSEVFNLIQKRNDAIPEALKEEWDQGVAMLLLEAELIGVPLSSTMNNIRAFVKERPQLIAECKRLRIEL